MLLSTVVCAAFAGTPRVHVRDLDPGVMPTEIRYLPGKERLEVDGALVRGSRDAQLEWLGQVLADESGAPPEVLRIEERRAALRQQRAGIGVILGAGSVGVVTSILAPPIGVVIGVAVGVLAVEGSGLALVLPARERFDGEALADDVDRLQALSVAGYDL